MIYIITSSILLLSVFAAEHRKYENKLLTAVFICILAILVGGRYEVGTDWHQYIDIYNAVDPNDFDLFSIEPLFYIILYLCRIYGYSYQVPFTVVSFIGIYTIVVAFRRFSIKNIYIPILIYFCCFFFQNQLNVMRQGLALSFIWLALSYVSERNLRNYTISILVGGCFHYSALVFYPFYFFINKIISPRVLQISLLAFYLMYISNISSLILSQLYDIPYFGLIILYYTEDFYGTVSDSDGVYGMTIGVIMNVIIVLYSFYAKKRLYLEDSNFRICVNSLLSSFFIVCAFNYSAIFVERLANTTNLSLCLILPYLSQTKSIKKGVFFLCLVMYLSLYLYKNMFAPGVIQPLQFLPYQFSWY